MCPFPGGLTPEMIPAWSGIRGDTEKASGAGVAQGDVTVGKAQAAVSPTLAAPCRAWHGPCLQRCDPCHQTVVLVLKLGISGGCPMPCLGFLLAELGTGCRAQLKGHCTSLTELQPQKMSCCPCPLPAALGWLLGAAQGLSQALGKGQTLFCRPPSHRAWLSWARRDPQGSGSRAGGTRGFPLVEQRAVSWSSLLLLGNLQVQCHGTAGVP